MTRKPRSHVRILIYRTWAINTSWPPLHPGTTHFARSLIFKHPGCKSRKTAVHCTIVVIGYYLFVFSPNAPRTNTLKYVQPSNFTLSQSIMNLVKIPFLFHFRAGFECGSIESLESLVAPSLNTTNNICLLQSQPLLFSCRAARPGVIRVCPCRSYRAEQVALCETC